MPLPPTLLLGGRLFSPVNVPTARVTGRSSRCLSMAEWTANMHVSWPTVSRRDVAAIPLECVSVLLGQSALVRNDSLSSLCRRQLHRLSLSVREIVGFLQVLYHIRQSDLMSTIQRTLALTTDTLKACFSPTLGATLGDMSRSRP